MFFFYALDILDGVEFSGADNKLHIYQNPPMGSEQVQARIKSAVEQQSAGVCMIWYWVECVDKTKTAQKTLMLLCAAAMCRLMLTGAWQVWLSRVEQERTLL